MIEIERVTKYTPELARRVRELLIHLSRSGKDKGEVSEEWFREVIASPWHDLLVAKKEGRIVGMAAISVTMGAGIYRNAYIEDFVVDRELRGGGVGKLLWEEIVRWGKEKGCRKLEFTSGKGREAAQAFYRKRGAKIYETNFFRFELID